MKSFGRLVGCVGFGLLAGIGLAQQDPASAPTSQTTVAPPAPTGSSAVSPKKVVSTKPRVFRAKDGPVHVSVTVRKVSRKNLAGTLWGVDGMESPDLVASIIVYIDGDELKVPRSALSDLCNVTSVTLSHLHGVYCLKLDGGAGADSYFAKIYMSESGVSKRTVHNTENPESYYESTTYHTEAPVSEKTE